MIEKLFNPKSIAIIGGTENLQKPGGAILRNILQANYKGEVIVVNPNTENIQGCKTYKSVETIPMPIDLAIMAIPAFDCLEVAKWMTQNCATKAFIVLSAGFGESSLHGKTLETKLIDIITRANGTLIGPNCIGAITPSYAGVFTQPIPKLNPQGIDFISNSGATAVFFIEEGLKRGLKVSSLISIGNGNQTGVEEILEHFDQAYIEGQSSKVKILYLESLKKPQKFLKHAISLRLKGCTIAAIKSGRSEAGVRAAQSHTGAMVSSDLAVDALFKKAGIIRCYGREQLLNAANILLNKELLGKNIVVVTHAGGPAVMLTDTLSEGGFSIPPIDHKKANRLMEHLFDGSSVENPIDFLATGTATQLDAILTFCRNELPNTDGIVTIIGSPGLNDSNEAFGVIARHQKESSIPIYTVMPSVLNTATAIDEFLENNLPIFTDEVAFGTELSNVFRHNKLPKSHEQAPIQNKIKHPEKAEIMNWDKVTHLLEAFNIPLASQTTATSKQELNMASKSLSYPVVMKVNGINHKSDVGGVILNITSPDEALGAFETLTRLPESKGVIIQEMLQGTELFIGAKFEPNFGYLVLCGLGGIFVELFKDIAVALAPISQNEALEMIESLKGKAIFEGLRGKKPINKEEFAALIVSISNLVLSNNSIVELDINPLIATQRGIIAVDGRITTV